MNEQVGNDSRSRRSFGRRLDTAGGKLMAIVAAVGVIASTVAGVKALLPKKVDEQADLGALTAHVVPLRSFQSHERLVASKSPAAPSGSGPVLVASSKPVAPGALLADPEPGPGIPGGPPSPDGSGGPGSPDGSGGPGSPDGSGGPGLPDGSGGPGSPDGSGGPAPTDGSGGSAPTDGSGGSLSPGISQRPITIKGEKLPKMNIKPKRILIRPGDLKKGAYRLNRGIRAKQKRENREFSIGRCAATGGDCPLTTGLEPPSVHPHQANLDPTSVSPDQANLDPTSVSPDQANLDPTSISPDQANDQPPPATPGQANLATRQAAATLALIREELRQLRQTKTTQGPDGRRDPLGIRLDYHLRLCGFSNQSVRVFWTLFDSKQPPRIPYDWDSNRLANTIERNSSGCQSVFPSFWVPIPARKGRFTVALAVYDSQGARRGPLIESRPFSS